MGSKVEPDDTREDDTREDDTRNLHEAADTSLSAFHVCDVEKIAF
jgi:hypothetical protein